MNHYPVTLISPDDEPIFRKTSNKRYKVKRSGSKDESAGVSNIDLTMLDPSDPRSLPLDIVRRKHKPSNLNQSNAAKLILETPEDAAQMADEQKAARKAKRRRRLKCCGICMIPTFFFLGLIIGLLFPRIPAFEPDLNAVIVSDPQVNLIGGDLSALLGFNVSIDNENFIDLNIVQLFANVTFGDLVLDVNVDGPVTAPKRTSSTIPAVLDLALNINDVGGVIDLINTCLTDGIANFTLKMEVLGNFFGIQLVVPLPPQPFLLPCSLQDIFGIDITFDFFGRTEIGSAVTDSSLQKVNIEEMLVDGTKISSADLVRAMAAFAAQAKTYQSPSP